MKTYKKPFQSRLFESYLVAKMCEQFDFGSHFEQDMREKED